MEHISTIDYVLYIALFLVVTTLLRIVTDKTAFPYIVGLLIVGFIGQFVTHLFHLDIHLSLSPDFIYFVLLPVLLFEAAMHINVHQFKLQFKTITFFATFGLLVSIFVVGAGLALLLNLPFEIALLFGAIISATDPIAVLALFKTLGAPKRLALVADGESMFNDATAVIAFRVISSFVVAKEAFTSQTLFQSTGTFIYVFIGSILLGIVLGYAFSFLIQRIKTDRILISATLTSLALGSFAAAEHFFHLSGVIATVIAGIAFGNLARGKIKSQVSYFVEEYFGYMGFVALSLVFFFASFTLDMSLFAKEIPMLLIVIVVVLIARAVSVYMSAFLTNKLPLFRNEPNIPLSWQHILNWGGLRGVIPLVLVYSLPDSFVYKELMLRFTFATFLFTLFVNGLTIKSLLIKLKLHLPGKEEKIVADEVKLFALAEARQKLHTLPQREFNETILKSMESEISLQENKYKQELVELSTSKEFIKSLKLQALMIERETLRKLFEQGRFIGSIVYEFESELDLQQDSLEYPAVYQTRIINKKGQINIKKPFRKRIIMLRRFVSKYKLLSKLLHISERDIISERYSLLRARLITSYAVLDYLDRLKKIFSINKKILGAIKEVESIQKGYIDKNKEEIEELSKDYNHIITEYQKKIISHLIY